MGAAMLNKHGEAICYLISLTKDDNKEEVLKTILEMEHATTAPIVLMIYDPQGHLVTECYDWKGKKLPLKEHAEVLGKMVARNS